MNSSNKMDYEAIENHSSEVSFIYDNLSDILENVFQIVRNMETSDSWNSGSHEVYMGKFDELYHETENIHAEIKNASVYLNNMVDSYKNIDEEIKNFKL